jgi:hypothetical protein
MIITVPTAQLCIKSEAPAIVIAVQYSAPYINIVRVQFVDKPVYSDFQSRAPPKAA